MVTGGGIPWAALALAAVVLLPFLGKAYTIDDPSSFAKRRTCYGPTAPVGVPAWCGPPRETSGRPSFSRAVRSQPTPGPARPRRLAGVGRPPPHVALFRRRHRGHVRARRPLRPESVGATGRRGPHGVRSGGPGDGGHGHARHPRDDVRRARHGAVHRAGRRSTAGEPGSGRLPFSPWRRSSASTCSSYFPSPGTMRCASPGCGDASGTPSADRAGGRARPCRPHRHARSGRGRGALCERRRAPARDSTSRAATPSRC